MDIQFEKRDVRIPMGARCGSSNEPIYGWHIAPAMCAGGLAAHKALKGQHWKWTVTHEGSGMHISPLCAMTRARALANVRAALALEFDWTRGEADTLAALRAARGIVDACRAIGEGG